MYFCKPDLSSCQCCRARKRHRFSIEEKLERRVFFSFFHLIFVLEGLLESTFRNIVLAFLLCRSRPAENVFMCNDCILYYLDSFISDYCKKGRDCAKRREGSSNQLTRFPHHTRSRNKPGHVRALCSCVSSCMSAYVRECRFFANSQNVFLAALSHSFLPNASTYKLAKCMGLSRRCGPLA